MLRAISCLKRGDFRDVAIVGSITLDRASRFKRRIALQTDSGMDFFLDLPEATYLADGDGLQLEDGKIIVVRAASEQLFEVHAHDATALARIAWHIGNRHTPCEITSSALYIQPDHVLAEMIEGLGGHVHLVQRPFEPEGGAYGGKGPLLESHHHGDHQHGTEIDHEHSPGTHHHTHHGHAHSHDHDHVGTSGGSRAPVSLTKVWRPD